jgi:hypothetical protein
VQFRHAARPDRNLYGLPVRKKDGRLFWPARGRGTYWSIELEAAANLGCDSVRIGPGWRYHRACACKPFAWVDELYRYRKSLVCDDGTEDKLRGHPIKLAINSLYGKLAQRVGNPRFGNMIWAGLITAWTRAKLIEAAALDPGAVLMLATDGILSKRLLPLDFGGELGQWTKEEHGGVFLVQPGLYWGPKKPAKRKLKTRGAASRYFVEKTGAFEAAWARYREAATSAAPPADLKPPVVKLPVDLFVGLRLSHARGKPLTAGRWDRVERDISFDWSGKRGDIRQARWDGGALWVPPPGGVDYTSCPHQADKDRADAFDLDRLELDDQRDWFVTAPPGFR